MIHGLSPTIQYLNEMKQVLVILQLWFLSKVGVFFADKKLTKSKTYKTNFIYDKDDFKLNAFVIKTSF